MITKCMTISRAPGTENTPMVKIANRTLDAMGFGIGASVVVAYEQERNVISISLGTKHESNNVLSKTSISGLAVSDYEEADVRRALPFASCYGRDK